MAALKLGLPTEIRNLIAQAAFQARAGEFDESLANLEILKGLATNQLPLLVGPLPAEDAVAQLDALIRR